MFTPTRNSSPRRRALAIGALVAVGAATVRPAVAQNTPVAQNAPGAPPEGAPPPPPTWPPPGAEPPTAYPPGAAPGAAPPGVPPAFVVSAPREPLPPIVMVHKARRGWVAGGAATFFATWGIALGTSWVLLGSKTGDDQDACTGHCRDFAKMLWIPVVGPILGDVADPGSEGRAPLIFWSLSQALGVAMFAYGIAGHDVPMRPRTAENRPTLQLLPMFARSASGMTLTARW